MRCTSCEMEINPQWTHAIDNNICPFCGKNIMEEHLRNLFSSLRTTMDSLKSYPDQLNDWMLSNHSYIKTSDPNLKSYLSNEDLLNLKTHKPEPKKSIKVETDQGEQEVIVEKIQSEERTNAFFARAEAVKPNIEGYKTVAEKTEKLKAIVQHIKQEGVKPGLTSSQLVEMEDQEILDYPDPDSSDIYSSIDSDDDIPASVLAMAKTGKQANSADLLKLQEHHNRVRESQQNFRTGAKGSFHRG